MNDMLVLLVFMSGIIFIFQLLGYYIDTFKPISILYMMFSGVTPCQINQTLPALDFAESFFLFIHHFEEQMQNVSKIFQTLTKTFN